jgi:guanylate kinase
MKLLNAFEKGKIFVISAPSGTGKTTLVQALLKKLDGAIVQALTCTTRAPRRGEVEGEHYRFLEKETFLRKKERGEFLESVEIYGYYYGTLKEDVDKELKKKKQVILVIDVQGALQLMDKANVTSIFIEPPSMHELEKRMRERKVDATEMIEKRLARAELELKQKNRYDYILTNDDFASACEVIKSIIIAENHKNGEKG